MALEQAKSGRRTIRVSDWFLQTILASGERHYIVSHGLPKDTRIVNCIFDQRFSLLFLLESAEWPEDPEGDHYLESNPILTEIRKEIDDGK